MNDELTPQEQEAFANLSRERMPAGLEERVVGAMRERGFIAPKRARVVRITNSRVAGLLAACIVLVVGAYSIGLHRGDERALQGVTPPQLDGTTRIDEPVPLTTMQSDRDLDTQSPREPVIAEERTAQTLERKLESHLDETTGKKDAEREQRRAEADDRSDVPVAESMGAVEMADPDKRMARERQNYASPQAPGTMKLSDGTALGSAAAPASPPEKRFMLNGSALIVSAPDSVRIVQDEQGRVLLIYTSDGIIKIRLADNP